MRKIITSEMVTLDGYFAGPKDELDWFVWDREAEGYGIDLARKLDTILFGRVTYEMMANYWPTASPSTNDPIVIDQMNNMPKIVFSRTLEKVEWKNTRLVKEIKPAEILKMKNQPGKDMVIYGSGSIVSALTNLGLIDEHYLFINPVVLGKGKSLFKDINRHKLKLIETKAFTSGVVLLRYQTEMESE